MMKPCVMAALAMLAALAGCDGAYRPGIDGSRPILNQNLPSNGQPEPASARPR